MEITNKKVLVTDGAGFIGSHIVESLLKMGAEVVVFDNFSTGTMDNIESMKQYAGLSVIKGDILSLNDLKKAMGNVAVVSHHAAELEVFTGINNMHLDLKINTEGTLNVLKTAMEAGVEKFIYASSGGVYGQAQSLPQSEHHPLDPHWPYGVSKLAGEKYCTMAWHLYGFATTSLRYSIVYGPREWYGRALTLFLKKCLENKPPVVFGDGKQSRDLVYISDVVEAHNKVIFNDNTNGKVFNIGSGKRTLIKNLAETIIKITALNLMPIYDNPKEGEESEYQPGRKRLVGELKDFVLDISYAKRIFGYSPKVGLEEGIKKELEWINNNRSRWNVKPRV